MSESKIFAFLKYLMAFILFISLFQNTLWPQGNALIVPGEGVGVLKLGESYHFIIQDLGDIAPSSWRKVQGEMNIEIWLSYKDLGMTLVFDYETKKLEKIIVLSQSLLVENTGIHVGSKESDVKKYFKDPSKDSKANELDYPHLGINFFIKNEDKTVYAIEVKKKRLSSILFGLISIIDSDSGMEKRH
jgi:hypothetical protein